MKHVREDLPDVQIMRPEVSARLAAVLDRMTEKDLALRHPDAASVEADLEDALAAEASRTGTSTGEATAVLRTLPADARRRLPLRLRLRLPVVLLILMVAVAGAIIYLLVDEGIDRTQRGTGPGTAHAGARRADRLRQAHLRHRLRPARRRRGAQRGGVPRRRPGPGHGVDDRALRERHADQAGGRDGRRRALRRRRAVGQRPPARDRDADARLDDGDLRLTHDADRRVAERRLDEARRRHGRAQPSRASSSRRATAPTATTSSGSRRSRRARTTSRSRS